MREYSQGDVISIDGYKGNFVVVIKNSFIKSLNVFHVCPVFDGMEAGPIHIVVKTDNDFIGTVACEHIKLIDPECRNCSVKDHIPYRMIMEVSDVIQGLFEYD